ncbi:hypothetical protein BT63DRAFT_464773 [Microthyrium microscopicum]|uniref:BZIP domain-containing protein n=1 Tax=Microthyrium microscopicum TaxID=703497 RepID=A0A6A6TXY3_9PEZI|nr:hypothetical protein BT63DRAFT_464773 [Microthyrium microscopicum]
MVSDAGKHQSQKHKPKRKISELDEAAARRRRTQTCEAQRAFRKRNKETITSLTLQNSDLQKTIEDLSACFLSFTDDLVASGWLEQDRIVAKKLQATIEQFIAITRASQSPITENPAGDEHFESPGTTDSSPAEFIQDLATPSPLKEPLPTATGIDMSSTQMILPNPQETLSRKYTTSTTESRNMLTQTLPRATIFSSLNVPPSPQSYPRGPMPTHNPLLDYLPRIPRSINFFKPSFAQKLQLEAIRAGLRLVSTAEDNSSLFYRTFNRILDLPTRETFRSRLYQALDDNKSLHPPPENASWSESESFAWLNASDVARHFRSIGIDIDSSLDIVEMVQMESGYWQGFATFSGNEQPYDMRALYHANELDEYAINPAYNNNGGYTGSSVTVDLSKLIHEIIQRTRCHAEYPTFNRHDLNAALTRAMVA